MKTMSGVDVLIPVAEQGNLRISFLRKGPSTSVIGFEFPFVEITQGILIEIMKQVGGSVKEITIAIRYGPTPFKFTYEGEVDLERLVGTTRIALVLAAQEAANKGLHNVAQKLDEIIRLAYR